MGIKTEFQPHCSISSRKIKLVGWEVDQNNNIKNFFEIKFPKILFGLKTIILSRDMSVYVYQNMNTRMFKEALFLKLKIA